MKASLLVISISILSFGLYSQKTKDAKVILTTDSEVIDFILLGSSELLILTDSEKGYGLEYHSNDGKTESVRLPAINLTSLGKDCSGAIYTLSEESVIRVELQPKLELSAELNRVDYDVLTICRELQGEKIIVDHISSNGAENVLGLYKSQGADPYDSLIVHYEWKKKSEGKVWNGHTADLTPMKRNSRSGYPGGRYSDRNGGSSGGMGAVYDRDSAGGPIYDLEPVYQERMQRTRTGQYKRSAYYSSKGSSIAMGGPRYFLQDDKVLVLSPGLGKFASYTLSGELLFNGKLRVPRPFFHSGTISDDIVQVSDGELFVISTGSAGTQFHLLDVQTGRATTLFKLKSWWDLSSWKIVDNMLLYMVAKGDEVELHQVDLSSYR